MIGSHGGAVCVLSSSRVDEICIAVAEWAKGPTAWGPSLPDGVGTGVMGSAVGVRGPVVRRAAGPGAGVVAGWG